MTLYISKMSKLFFSYHCYFRVSKKSTWIDENKTDVDRKSLIINILIAKMFYYLCEDI